MHGALEQKWYNCATSVGGVLTGRGADLIVIDDPLKAEEAWSDSRRRAVNDWFDTSLVSRLNDKASGAIVLVMQRLHEDDLVGHVLQQEGWDLVSFPAIAEEDEVVQMATPYGPRRFARAAGEALHPAREPLALLARLKTQMGAAAFSAQYQQSPRPRDGAMVKGSWFPRYAAHTLPGRFDMTVLSCDTANKASELADYSAFTLWGVKERHLWLLAVLRRRMEFPELKRALAGMAARHKADVVLIEDRASGTQLLQELQREGIPGVTGIQPQGDKRMRLWAQTATLEQGFVHLPDTAPWLDAYLAELTSFPNTRHDDQVDSTTQAMAWIAHGWVQDPWLELAREELEKRGKKWTGTTMVRRR
jgi:predicted phage terminase large subunit-like protein